MIKRLLSRRTVDHETNCWNWNGHKLRAGYGIIAMNNRKTTVHRLAAFLWLNFDLKSDLCVLHKCDNPSCFNPDHLWIGTHTDNMRDMARKKRNFIPNGELCGMSKLKNEQVLQIRNSGESLKKLAKKYGVGTTIISYIKNGRRWRHILPLKCVKNVQK